MMMSMGLLARNRVRNVNITGLRSIPLGLRYSTEVKKNKTTTTTMSSEELYEFGERYVTRGLGRLTRGFMERGRGSWVEYDDGKRYLDFTSGIGVTALGHCHPRVGKAVVEQCGEIVHAQCSIGFHKPYVKLVEKLVGVVPEGMDSFFFWNSGAEAVEAAIKVARGVTGRLGVVGMQGGYHGRTYGAMAVTSSKTIYHEGAGSLMPGAYTIPFPYWHQHNVLPSTPTATLVSQSLYQLELLLAQRSAPGDTAAIIVEPVLGEGGYVPAPPEFLRGLREVCDRYGMMLIVDEVQSGFGRTGRFFMVEESGVRPDMLVIAKGLANGFPLSGVVSRRELTDKLKPGSMGGTYAGNAVSCAAAIAVMDVFEEENILENVQARSKELLDSLHELQKDPAVAPYILDVRGLGLMVAVEFTSPRSPGGAVHDVNVKADSPASLASRVAKRCIEKGLLILTTGAYETVRFIPPLNISQEDLEVGSEIFAEAVRDVVKEG